ncbi:MULTISPECIES: hypothetical protein [Chryseobacterium]|uniref:GyrI-like small molecule binding domain-containing protein n=1 Tax=Chryseobacterium camelliae TaxID=1265445 RepID=A0ABU0TEX5_9FLAO|nr:MULTISPECIES: hypothetical protein [Chryseobacterium]MDT3406833.1 hypothetical protein [Pseudacidovorax intermedius]MDQ1095371.1 hypothetical protein [Chryseobacterium camelliae]MDQ1099309.1 hypothetical protein [Chryseobacterium sp. SORGH_AS_1048]MDR6086658.1 hypothetical protein [Chryseobacterium sp. SORGH_AS_0909]MDR6131030.1 hypothetical protein [Chryseobacterium sp. SORGH_AS_1175]
MNTSKQYQDYFTASTQPEIIEISRASYVSILGSGSPGTDAFYAKKKAIAAFAEALYSGSADIDNAIASNIVEIFYWFDEDKVGYVDIGNFYTTVDLALLQYRIAIGIPDFFTDEHIRQVAWQRKDLAFANAFEHFEYTAGKCVQILHSGPFAGELETLPILQEFATANGLKKSGMHQEIHLVSFERGQSQAHLQTILRDPVSEVSFF